MISIRSAVQSVRGTGYREVLEQFWFEVEVVREVIQAVHLTLPVEGPPESQGQVYQLLPQGPQGKHYPVGHPVYILLG